MAGNFAFVDAELSKDGTLIVAVATGEDWQMHNTALVLTELTPLSSKSEKTLGQPGGMTIPLTWAAIVQLAHTFAPNYRTGPRLTEWITAELARREQQPAELYVTPPAGLVPYPWQIEGAAMFREVGSGLLWDDPGPQPVSTPILTAFGWSMLGDLGAGDQVYASDGQPATVTGVKHHGTQQTYRVTLSDGTSTLATAQHRWHVFTSNDRKRRTGGRVLTTAELRGRNEKGASEHFLPQQPILNIPYVHSLPLDAYAYGALLGDGYLGGANLSITCPDDYVLEHTERAAAALGTTSRRFPAVNGKCQYTSFHRNGSFAEALIDLTADLPSHLKSVDNEYLFTGEDDRRAVLAGLLDTDGTVTNQGAGVEFSSASPMLARDVAWLARSLGAVVTEAEPQATGYRNAEGVRIEARPRHRLHMRFPADGPNPFRLPRKADVWARDARTVQRRNPPRSIERVELFGEDEVCCIALDREPHVYLTDTALIPTHNTGKTVTGVLAAVERAATRAPVLPVLVVAPSSVVDSWIEHFQTWAPFWRVAAWRGTPKKRMQLLHTSDIYVASYGVVRKDAEDMDPRYNPLIALRPNMLIVDEAHKIKDQGAEQSRAVRRIASKITGGFLGLTGTPITHNPGDIWPQLNSLAPLAYPSRDRWIKRYCHHVQKDYSVEAVGFNHREDEYRLTIKGQSRRVAKADVLDKLPPKVYSVRHVELPPMWRKVYDEMEQDMLAELPDGGQLSVMGVLAKLTRLQQLAAAAADVHVSTEVVPDLITGLPVEKEHVNVTLKMPSWKIEEMIEVFDERPGRKGVVFSPSRQLIMLAAQRARATGRKVGYIVGGQTAKERTANVNAFQAGELDAVFATTGAGGVGLTLTAASFECFLNRPFSLVESLQAEDRAHRIGSEVHESIEIIDIVAKNTIESRIRQVIRQRAGSLSDFVQDPRIVAEILGGASVTQIRKAS